MPCNTKDKIPEINCNVCKNALNCPDIKIRNANIDRVNAQVEAKRPHEPTSSYGEFYPSSDKGDKLVNYTNISGRRQG